MKKPAGVDKPLLGIVLFLSLGGFLVFMSAAMGALSRGAVSFGSIVTNQLIALGIGLTLMTVFSLLRYSVWRKSSSYIFLAGLVISLALFIPGVGLEHGGAVRWISLGPLTFQPSELLKFGFILYCAAWLTGVKHKIHRIPYGLMPLVIIFAIAGVVLLLQPDTDSFIIIATSGIAMFIAAGARWRDVSLLGFFGASVLTFVLLTKDYIQERILVFFNPGVDMAGSSYQIQQSLIAVGSGEVWGRGFGQSIQKFGFLPEPFGDSIFAIAAEEFGLVGGVIIIFAFVALLYRGLLIATRIPDIFGRLIVVGVVILIVSQSFSNIAGMLNVLPLSGTPLLFISHGGTALMMVLAMMGIVLNVSRYQKK